MNGNGDHHHHGRGKAVDSTTPHKQPLPPAIENGQGVAEAASETPRFWRASDYNPDEFAAARRASERVILNLRLVLRDSYLPAGVFIGVILTLRLVAGHFSEL